MLCRMRCMWPPSACIEAACCDDSAIHMTTVELMQVLRRYFKLYHTCLIFRAGLGHRGSHARLGRFVLQEHRSPVLRALAVTSRDALSCCTSLRPFRLMWHLAWLWSIDFQTFSLFDSSFCYRAGESNAVALSFLCALYIKSIDRLCYAPSP